MRSQTSDSEHVYELKKVKMSQDKDGYLVVFRLHHTDQDSDLSVSPLGRCSPARSSSKTMSKSHEPAERDRVVCAT